MKLSTKRRTAIGGVTLDPTDAANVSHLTFRQDETVFDPNDTSVFYWSTIKINSSHWLPTNSPCYYITLINYIYY